MSALNQSETSSLRNAQAIIERVLRDGYKPDSEDANDLLIGTQLRRTKRELNIVTQMKGHYPK